MASFKPTKGMKRPLNMLENPVFPVIKKTDPEFKWSGKFWRVDEGSTMRDTEHVSQFYEPAILAQNRDYNINVYGKSSHKEIVNAVFRPPLIDQYEDLGPLNRIPVKTVAIVPRINPGTAGHGGGTSSFSAQVDPIDDKRSAIQWDRIKQVNPNRGINRMIHIEVPMDNSILPDLKGKLPSVSVSAGWQYSGIDTMDSRGQGPLGINGDLKEKKPLVAADAGFKTQVTVAGSKGFLHTDLHESRPLVSATSGMNARDLAMIETPIHELQESRPLVSATSGMSARDLATIETPIHELQDSRPSVSAHSGMNNRVTVDGGNALSDLQLETKIEGFMGDLDTGNPEYGYQEVAEIDQAVYDKIRYNRPSYSYQTPQELQYRERNELTYTPHFRKRLQAEKSYGQISQSGGYIPQMGRQELKVQLKSENDMATRRSGYRF